MESSKHTLQDCFSCGAKIPHSTPAGRPEAQGCVRYPHTVDQWHTAIASGLMDPQRDSLVLLVDSQQFQIPTSVVLGAHRGHSPIQCLQCFLHCGLLPFSNVPWLSTVSLQSLSSRLLEDFLGRALSSQTGLATIRRVSPGAPPLFHPADTCPRAAPPGTDSTRRSSR